MNFEIYYLPIWLFFKRRYSLIKRILLVDADARSSCVFATAFVGHGFSVERVSNGLSALERIDAETYDLIISELDLYYLRGADLYQRVVKKRPELEGRFLFIGACEPEDARERAIVRGRFFLKPLPTDFIVDHVLDLLKVRLDKEDRHK